MKVAIIGGGYAGFNLARLLDTLLDVTLIEAREAFVHNVAAIRAAVEPALLERIVLPYDRLLKRGRVVQGRAVAIKANCVQLTDGTEVEADAVVVATGSHYAAPFKPQADSAADFSEQMRAVSAQIAGAEQVVIVGAGAVGVELAGEIKAAYPARQVALVSDQPQLFPMYPVKLHDRLVERLAALGVALHLGQAASGLAQVSAPYDGAVTLADGTQLVGLIVPATGGRIAESPAHVLPGTVRQHNGQLAVDAWLRPSSLPRVFAIGDLAATGEGMTVVSTMRQTPWLAKTLRKLAQGTTLEDLPPYARWKVPPILLPLGPARGASVLPLGQGMVVGDWMTSMIKGRHLFIPRYHKEFGR
ncbi:MAG: FAD-dependent oxidoreductase [Sphingomonadaceae bacterium]|nr:FAD-dependent oxidoreductase [Sphingomonadaceae bacterium]